LQALYAGYYIAELLGDWTEEYDPHPLVFEEALAALRALGTGEVPTGLRLLRFEMVLLRELGYAPELELCAGCRRPLPASGELTFSAAAGGVVCGQCPVSRRGQARLTRATWAAARQLGDAEAWRTISPEARTGLRRLFNHYVCYLLGRRPRTMPYLGS
jgi:DNA repair protein RecO (recombination protein O)